MLNQDCWFSVKEIFLLCFKGTVNFSTVYTLVWELPLSFQQTNRLVGNQYHNLHLFKFNQAVYDFMMQIIESNPVGSLSTEEINLFKYYRLRSKISQKTLAGELSVALSTIRRWENGKCEPTLTIYQVKKICKLYRINLNNLPDSFIAKKVN